MKSAEKIEELLADSLPHARHCPQLHCVCGANAQRAKILLHIHNHVEHLTRGRVYLDR